MNRKEKAEKLDFDESKIISDFTVLLK